MNPKRIVLAVLSAAVLFSTLAAPARAQSCVGFEPPLAVGTNYGAPVSQPPATVIFTTNGIPVRIYHFQLINAGWIFNRAYIDLAPVPFSPNQSIRSNNINLLFDLTRLPFKPKKVTLSYLDLGGYENLSVNGSSPYHVGELTAAPAVLGGVNVSVTSTPVPPPMSGKRGTLTLSGNVTSLMIGGQELWIDQVCAQ